MRTLLFFFTQTVLTTIVVCLFFTIPHTTNTTIAAETEFVDLKQYKPLAGEIPLISNVRNLETSNFSSFIINIYRLFTSGILILAVIMIIWHGFRYAVSDNVGTRTNARTGLKNVFLGLGLVFGSYLILYTINPRLVEFRLGAGGLIQDDLGVPVVPEPDTIDYSTPKDCAEVESSLSNLGLGSGTPVSGTPTQEGVYMFVKTDCLNSDNTHNSKEVFFRMKSYDRLLIGRADKIILTQGNFENNTTFFSTPADNDCHTLATSMSNDLTTATCRYFTNEYALDAIYAAKTPGGQTVESRLNATIPNPKLYNRCRAVEKTIDNIMRAPEVRFTLTPQNIPSTMSAIQSNLDTDIYSSGTTDIYGNTPLRVTAGQCTSTNRVTEIVPGD